MKQKRAYDRSCGFDIVRGQESEAIVVVAIMVF